MANFTTTTSAVFVPEQWSAKAQIAAENKLVAAKLVSRYDSDVSGKGDLIHIPIVSNFSAADTKAADTDVTLTAITESEKTLTVDKHVYKAFAVEDRLAKQSGYDLTSYYAEKAGYAVAKAVDTSLLSLYSDLTTTDVGSYEAHLSAATVLAAIQTLMQVDAPRDEMSMIVSAYEAGSMLGIEQFVKADWQGNYDQATRVANGVASEYRYGQLYGIPVYYSNNVQVTSGTTSSTHNLLFHKEAFALAMQMAPRTSMQWMIQKLADVVVVDTIYGVTTTRPTFGVEMRSVAP